MTAHLADVNIEDEPSDLLPDREIVKQLRAWTVEREPESGAYLLIDSAGAYCADLKWNAKGECWAHFEPYIAFAGPTTIADIEALQDLATLLRGLPAPKGHATRNAG
jgi:hypothetical protein